MSDDPQPLSYAGPHTTFSGVAIGTIGLQLVGIYFFVHALPIAAMFITTYGVTRGTVGTAMLGTLIPLAVYIAIGVFLIRLAPRLSVWLFRDVGGGIMSGPITTEVGTMLQGIAFSILGVAIAATSIPTILQLLWLGLADMGRQFPEAWQFVLPVTQLLVGVGLFLQSKGLTLFWHRIRTGGIAATEPVHSEDEKA